MSIYRSFRTKFCFSIQYFFTSTSYCLCLSAGSYLNSAYSWFVWCVCLGFVRSASTYKKPFSSDWNMESPKKKHGIYLSNTIHFAIFQLSKTFFRALWNLYEKQSRLSIPYQLEEIPGNCSFQKGQQARWK